jgi:hypothetical protein
MPWLAYRLNRKKRLSVERYFYSRFFVVVILEYEVYIEYPPEGDIRILWPPAAYCQLLTGISPDSKVNYSFFRGNKKLPSISKDGKPFYLAKSETILEWAKEDSKINPIPYPTVIKLVKAIDKAKNKAFEEVKRRQKS